MSRFINPDIPFFLDNGNPNALGTVYFGEPNQNARTNPKVPYLDAALTTPASATQSLNAGGKLAQKLYLKGNYSVIADDADAVQVDEDLNWGGNADVTGSIYLVDDYTELRARDSSNLSDGDVLKVTDDGIAGDFIVKTGTVTDNGGTLIVFTDDSNRYVERIVDGGVVWAEWFGYAADWNGSTGTNNSVPLQAAIDFCSANLGEFHEVTAGPGRAAFENPIKMKKGVSLWLAGQLSGAEGGSELVANFSAGTISTPPTDLFYDPVHIGGGTITLDKTPFIYNTELLTQQRIGNFRLNCNNQDLYGIYLPERYSSYMDFVRVVNCPNAPYTFIYNQSCEDGLLAAISCGGAIRQINCTAHNIKQTDIEANNSAGTVLDMVHDTSTKGANVLRTFYYEESSGTHPTGSEIIKISGRNMQILSGNWTTTGTAPTRSIQLAGTGDTYSFDGVTLNLTKAAGCTLVQQSISAATVDFELRTDVAGSQISTSLTPSSSWDSSGRTDNYIESNVGGGARFGRDFQVLASNRDTMLFFGDDNSINLFNNSNRLISKSGANMALENLAGNTAVEASGNVTTSSVDIVHTITGNFRIATLPTSSAGLPSNSLWNDGGTVKVT